jgi:protein DJ-1
VATSAYVSTASSPDSGATTTASGQGQVTLISPPMAKCSRGVRIMPDVYFEPSASGFGPVCLRKVHVDALMISL